MKGEIHIYKLLVEYTDPKSITKMKNILTAWCKDWTITIGRGLIGGLFDLYTIYVYKNDVDELIKMVYDGIPSDGDLIYHILRGERLSKISRLIMEYKENR